MPSGAEVCDGLDNDCNGRVDEGQCYQVLCGMGSVTGKRHAYVTGDPYTHATEKLDQRAPVFLVLLDQQTPCITFGEQSCSKLFWSGPGNYPLSVLTDHPFTLGFVSENPAVETSVRNPVSVVAGTIGSMPTNGVPAERLTPDGGMEVFVCH